MSRSRGHRRRSKPECGVGTGNRRPELGCRVGAHELRRHVPALRPALAASRSPSVASAGIALDVTRANQCRVERDRAIRGRVQIERRQRTNMVGGRGERVPGANVEQQRPATDRAVGRTPQRASSSPLPRGRRPEPFRRHRRHRDGPHAKSAAQSGKRLHGDGLAARRFGEPTPRLFCLRPFMPAPARPTGAAAWWPTFLGLAPTSLRAAVALCRQRPGR